MRVRDHEKEELSFYSKATTDIEFLFPFGWGELWGIADRTDYDLSRHAEVSGQDLSYFDDSKNEKYIPYVVEPSLGADRVVLAFLCAAYDEEELEGGDVRTVLHSILLWHRLKSASCRCPRSSTRVQRRSIPSCARSTTANLTTEAISVRDIAVRMKSVRRSALPTISNPRQTAA